MGLDYKGFAAELGASFKPEHACSSTEGGISSLRTISYGTSSIAMHVGDFFYVDGVRRVGETRVEKCDFTSRLDECSEFARCRGLDVLMVLSFCCGTRQIGLLLNEDGPAALSPCEYLRLVQALVSQHSLQLSSLLPPDSEILSSSKGLLHLFSQAASTASRKQVVPLWNDCISNTVAD